MRTSMGKRYYRLVIGQVLKKTLSSPRAKHARAVSDRQSPKVGPDKDFSEKNTVADALKGQ